VARRPCFLDPFLRSAPDRLGLYIGGSSVPLAGVVEAAVDSATRRRGLLGRSHLPVDAALIIAPCQAVHTFGMQFAIDVIYAARDGRVIKLHPNLGAARISAAFTAFAAIEMAAGAIDRAGVRVGDRLEIR
jgi:hypothetical protein